jgi:hypothetical protein
MSDDADLLPARERARVRSRDRKVRGPRVVVDNPGLRQLALHLAERRRAARADGPAQTGRPPRPRKARRRRR